MKRKRIVSVFKLNYVIHEIYSRAELLEKIPYNSHIKGQSFYDMSLDLKGISTNIKQQNKISQRD